LKSDHPDRSTLAVTDKYGRPVFSVRYLNKSAVKIIGMFVYPEAKITLREEQGSILSSAMYEFSRTCWGDVGIDVKPNGIVVDR
jgi:hypothetical protein